MTPTNALVRLKTEAFFTESGHISDACFVAPSVHVDIARLLQLVEGGVSVDLAVLKNGKVLRVISYVLDAHF